MVLIIDNYDSFTYNLYQYIGVIEPDVRVVRNDSLSVADVIRLMPKHVVISPGPGYPSGAGISIELIKSLGLLCPVLGICLGHQAIGEAFGGRVTHAPCGPVHGKRSKVRLEANCPLFSGIPQTLDVGRYHSLVVDRSSLPEKLKITAETEDGLVMGLQHIELPIYGVQFHPESVLTEYGQAIIKNFLN